MRILVVGGAGYIGSHVARHLIGHGHEVWVFDSLVRGHRAAAPEGRLIVGDLGDGAGLEACLREHRIEAVMHFAAFALVPESVSDPALYYRNNVVGSLNLLDAMRAAGVPRIVFSSTCAVYGNCEPPIVEETPRRPINPYGFTKLVIEHALADYAAAYGLGYSALRYFNACGASGDGTIGEDHAPETHLIPLILEVALGRRESVSIFGTDYPTPDGSCIRDYIHVEDLAEAHRLALERIAPGSPGLVLNLGTGQGVSVREVIESARRVTGHPIPAVERPRRPGDPAVLIASAGAARRELGWTPKFTEIDAIVESAWRWHSTHPRGFDDAR
jgi:UDP-glucose-4-epimerase GalE